MMKKVFLNIIVAILIVSSTSYSTNAYTSAELITLHVDSPDVWTSIYIVPEGFDLVLTRLNVETTNEVVEIRNSTGSVIAHTTGKVEYTGGEVVIQDDLQIISTPGTNVHIMLFGFLVSEDEDIEYYIEGTSSAWNKHVFDKADIDFIYFREFIFFIFLMVIKFFEFILGRKLIMK